MLSWLRSRPACLRKVLQLVPYVKFLVPHPATLINLARCLLHGTLRPVDRPTEPIVESRNLMGGLLPQPRLLLLLIVRFVHVQGGSLLPNCPPSLSINLNGFGRWCYNAVWTIVLYLLHPLLLISNLCFGMKRLHCLIVLLQIMFSLILSLRRRLNGSSHISLIVGPLVVFVRSLHPLLSFWEKKVSMP